LVRSQASPLTGGVTFNVISSVSPWTRQRWAPGIDAWTSCGSGFITFLRLPQSRPDEDLAIFVSERCFGKRDTEYDV